MIRPLVLILATLASCGGIVIVDDPPCAEHGQGDAGACDVDAVCLWLRCTDEPQACQSHHDCCANAQGPCTARCIPLSCGGICALPVE